MNVEPLKIIGAFKISPKKIQDKRGIFGRMFCAKEFETYGMNTQWVQMNTSISNVKGTVRGLHFQRPPHSEIKLVRCVRGKIIDIVLDLRKGSPSYGYICSINLNSKNMDMVYIPEGCAHGFQALTDSVELHYCHSKFYAPKFESGINVLDPDLAINWPLPLVNLSFKDANYPIFKKTEPLIL
jgi:dTDP-4-dehydrorhamnose 3,5-epimerase|tara:strand:- start:1233 stop:1781 length:549 start_codon:yes stop_codon:yes gene_type:complete